MELLERIKEIEKSTGLNREDFGLKIGIKYSRLRNVIGGQARIRIDDLEAIAEAFPEYKHWLVFGEELPEAGQISPMTKQEQDDYQIQGRAG